MRAFGTLDCFWQIPVVCILLSRFIIWSLDLFKGRYCSLTFTIVILRKVSFANRQAAQVRLTDEPRLYSSKSLELSSSMSSISVYAEMGRSSEVRADTPGMRNDCDLPLWNISLGSSGVMGVMAC
jgi:hypothetical protein